MSAQEDDKDELDQLKSSFREIGKQLKSSSKIVARQIKAQAERAREELEEKTREAIEAGGADPSDGVAARRRDSLDDRDKARANPTERLKNVLDQAVSSGRGKALVAALCLVLAIICFACFQSCAADDASYEQVGNEESAPKPAQMDLTLEVKENVMLSRYNVRAEIEGESLGTVEHGKTKTFAPALTKGTHTLTLYRADNEETRGSVTVEFDEDEPVYVVASCNASEITAETLSAHEVEERYGQKLEAAANQSGKKASEVIAALNALEYDDHGYTLTCLDGSKELKEFDEKKFDVVAGSVNRDEKTVELKLKANAPVKVSFDEDMALRAVVVATTNSFAPDVFGADGSTYDPAKFHPYSNISGFYLTVEDKGTWKGKDEATWRVEKLKMRNAEKSVCYMVDADVSHEEGRYIVTNATISYGPSFEAMEKEEGSVSTEELEANDNRPYLYVSDALVADDRNPAQEKVQSEAVSAAGSEQTDYDSWVESQFSLWDGNNSSFEKLVKNRLNDERSFRDAKTGHIACRDQATLDQVNGALSKDGVPVAKMNDVYITMEFSAKNGFGARVKNTAHGIIRYPSGDVELLAIS